MLTAVFTGGLLIVAIVTAVLGLRAARTANDIYRLESAPVIVVDRASTNAAHADEYVLTFDTSSKAMQLRRSSYEADEPLQGSGINVSPHYGGRPEWPRLTLELRNVGRSPAIYPRLNIRCEVSPPNDLDYAKVSAPPEKAMQLNAAPWTVGRDYPCFVERATQLLASIETPVIAAGDKAFIRIENRVAAYVRIKLNSKADERANVATTIIDGTTEPLDLQALL